ncbi:hypothetical protein CO151_07350 [bacterium CG_4_9_14_3_um_filter_65_15]|nr:MAG: hypothetical protein CO151_07350 [bacterium CG_4_9_14_3_um_filter_65_15]
MSDTQLPDDGFHPFESPPPEPDAGPFRPLQDIWLAPRATIRRLVDYDPGYMVIPLVMLAGIAEALGRASSRDSGDEMSLFLIILLALIGGPLSGLISVWASSHLLLFTGRWMDGVATRDHLRTAVAWSAVPAVAVLGLTMLEIVIFGDELFRSVTPRLDASPGLGILIFLFALVEGALSIWSVVILAKTVAEVQGFSSAWKGLGNVVMSALVILAPLVALFTLIALLAKLG